MCKFKIGDKIMGISTDMLGIRIVSGTIEDLIENKKPDMTRYIVDEGIINNKDFLYEGETIVYDGFKLEQAKNFYKEADKLEKKADKLRNMARTAIYSQGSK